jgi:hypothetical protein
MKAIILLGAAALPLAAHGEGVLEATSAPQSYTVIDVEYWGTVSSALAGPRRVGDAVSGSMRIDLRFAPSDFWDTFASEGEYIWNFPCERNCEPYPDAPSRFVTTRGAPVELGGNSFDHVHLLDKTEGTAILADEFSVRDWELGSGTGEDYSELRVSLSASSRLVDFIHGDDLLQEFDLRPSEMGGDTRAGGSWHEALSGMTATLFDFAIDRLRVKPKICRI